MPKDLAALLVEEGAVPTEVMERALAQQREAGGTLDTALLETGAIAEDALAGWLSRAAELPVPPAEAWSADDARARRVFPSRVAERHGLAPFALDGRELSLVATYPVDLGLLDEISFMLSLHLTAHVGPEWRVRELIHRLYGTPLPARLAALALAAGAAPAHEETAARHMGDEAAPASQAAAAGAGFARDESEPLEPLAAALAQALEAVETPAPDEGPSARAAAPAAEADRDGREANGDPADPAAKAPDRTAPPRWTLEDARAALAAARDRDEVVLATLRYARDFFELAAMFAVTRDAIAGHDALGPEDARERCRSVAIWASDPGAFKTAVETRSPHLGPFAPDAPGNEAILAALGREPPRTALVFPVLLRDRPICVLYADNGEAPVSHRRLGDLLLFLATVGGAFERIIRDRKEGPRSARRPGTGAEAAPAPARRDREPPREPQTPLRAERSPDGDAAGEAQPRPAPAPVSTRPPPEPSPDVPRRSAPQPAADTLDVLYEQFFSVTLDLSDLDAPEAPAPPPQPAPAPPRDGEEAHRAATPTAAEAERPAASTDASAQGPQRSPPPDDPPAPAALAERALDADPGVAAAACDALAGRRRDPALRPAVEKLRRALLSGMSGRAIRGARALGALRDVDSIPLLIQVLETSEPEAAAAAADALSAITLQRLGPDARRWLGWWKENRGRGRAEWLFSGLTSADRQTRVAASVELSLAAPPPVAYSADMPAAEREKAARAWAGWWSRSGHVL